MENKYEIDYASNYVLLSDIHGNYEALVACINDAIATYGNSIKGFIFLGDYICDFVNSQRIFEIMSSLQARYNCYIIQGNREYGMLKTFYSKTKDYYVDGKIDILTAEKLTGWSLDTSMGVVLIDCCGLSKEQVELFVKLPETMVLENQRQTFYLKHKMPLDDDEIKYLKEESKKKVSTLNGDVNREVIVLTGHTHDPHQNIYDGIRMFNPGSVGLADEGVKGADYGILSHGKLINKHIDYDYEKEIATLEEEEILFNRCQGWGKCLKLSIESGFNVPVLFINEYKRLVAKFQNLSPEQALYFTRLEFNDAVEYGKSIFPKLDEKKQRPFSQGRYGNSNVVGGHLEIPLYLGAEDSLEPINKSILTDDLDKAEELPKMNTITPPKEVLNTIAFDYTLDYLGLTDVYTGKYLANVSRWK